MDTSLIKPPTLEVSYSELMAQTIDNPKQQDPGDIFLSTNRFVGTIIIWFGKKKLMTRIKGWNIKINVSKTGPNSYS